MKSTVKQKLNGLESHHALDAISSKGTWIPVSHMLSPPTEKETTYLSVVSGANKYDEETLGEGVNVVYTYCGTVHSGAYRPGMPKQGNVEDVKHDPEFGYLLFRYLARMLADGRFSGHPYVVVEGGLDGVGKGLNMLKEGKARGNKFVFKIGEDRSSANLFTS